MANDTDQEIEEFLEIKKKNTLLRLSTAGSVDDGKSTLIGRLLHDSKNLCEDHLEKLDNLSNLHTDKGSLALAHLVDGLKAEQEQGITIDVAYRYFSTPKRHFILADTPGHEQYTRNMATGSSTANLSVVLVDARKGVLTQTKRHSFIAALLGVPRLLVAVNKMDLVDFDEGAFNKVRDEFQDFASKIDVQELRFVPISALHGDNVVEKSNRMTWYNGETIMDYLETVYIGGDTNLVDFRFPVQSVIRPNQDFRGYAGQISSGTISVGQEVTVLPSMRTSRVQSIVTDMIGAKDGALETAFAPMSVVLTLEDEIDLSRGDMIVRSSNVPTVEDRLEGMVIWMHDQPMDPNKQYILRHTTRETKAIVEEVKYRVDVNTLHRDESAPLKLNEIGRVSFRTTNKVCIDPYKMNRATGNFVLIDPMTYVTVGAGLVIERIPPTLQAPHESETDLSGDKHVSTNISKEISPITEADRRSRFGHKAFTLWFTGLSGSGKSTIAQSVEKNLFDDGRSVYRLDGDNVRFGINRDLGFSQEDRTENIRRVAEVARLFNDAGFIVLCSLISPFEKDRTRAREIIGEDHFIEVFVDTPIEECESRDPKGLYKKARSGEISEFTGVTSPYEAPEKPEIRVQTAGQTPEESVAEVLGFLKKIF